MWFKNLFGEDYYLEVQANSLREQLLVNQQLISMSKKLNIPLVATNDSHYLRKEDYYNHEVLLCVQTGKRMTDEDRMSFSTNDYYLSEGLELSPTDYNNLLKRDPAGTKEEDKKYPDTLQVESGKTYEGLQSPVLVSNITEQDYYKKSGSSYALKGISVAIILDPKEQIDGKLSSPAVTLSDEKLRSYAQQCVKKTYKYIRTKKKKLADVPVLIGIYRANNNEISETNGNYIYESFCEGGSTGTLKKVNHENVFFTSSRASKLDPATASDFATIKSNLKKASTEAAGLVGEANYINDTIQTMKITAHLNIKTYTELLYLTSVIADNINSKFTQDFNIKVLVYSQDELMAVIIKQKGEDAKTSILEQ